MSGPVVRARCELRPHPESVGEARRFVRSVVDRAGGQPELAETAELVVSEVVTNAVLHAGTAVAVAVRAGAGRLRVEVGDGSQQVPRQRSYDRLVSTGRGLHILEAVVDDWGVELDASGKTVWFELTPGGGPHSATAGGVTVTTATRDSGPAAAEAAAVEVVLLDVPLLLHEAWQMHAESLLREYVLTRLDGPDTEHELRAHAELNAALGLLRDHITAPQLQSEPDALMADATEPLVSAARLVMRVPEESVPAFHALEQTLEAAAVMAEDGVLLTVPIQPELRELRHWLCGQVREQAAGGRPAPWRPDTDQPAPPSPRREAPRWEDELGAVVAEVAAADRPMIGADDTNRIVAVSPSAVELLGHGAADDLVGRRLVVVIPERYHQAHVAGFTLHLLTGRAPLLEHPVTLPVRTADGGEVPVRLTVSARSVGARSVFLAELEPVREERS